VVQTCTSERIFLIPSVFGNESSEELIHQRIGHAALLSIILAFGGRVTCGVRVVVGGGSGPNSNNTISGSNNTGNWNFKSNDTDVGDSQNVVGIVLCNASREDGSINGNEIDQIEDLSEIDDEGFSTLSNENLSRARASWNGNGINELIRIILIVGNGFVSSIVEGNLPIGDSIDASDGCGSRGSDVVNSVIGKEIQSRAAGSAQGRNHLQSNGHLEAGNVQGEARTIVGKFVVENERESDLWFPISSVVDEDIQSKLLIPRIEIGASLRELSWIPVGEEGHIS